MTVLSPRARLALVPAVLALMVMLAPTATAQQSAPDPPDLAAIDRYVEAERTATGLPGIALGIVRGDQIVHLRGFGAADPSGRPVTPDTPFVMASVGKSFTALAIMQLVEAGKVDLDAPVQRYLPWFRVADPAASAQITVRHLLNQTSGLSRLTGNRFIRSRDLSDGALEREVRSLATEELTAPVGQTWQYCNANYSTLGLIVQTLSGQPYEDYVRERIFAPLDMDRSYASPGEAGRNGLATGHAFWFGQPRPTPAVDQFTVMPNRAHVPAGLISSSAEDMAHYLIAHLNEGRYRDRSVVSPAGIAHLHRPSITISGRGSYALGWAVGDRPLAGGTVRTIGHNGGTGDFYAEMTLLPDHGWGVVLLTNAENTLQTERTEAIAGGVVAQLLGQPAAPPPFPESQLILFTLLGVLAVQALAIGRSVLLLRRWRRQPDRRPRGALAAARVALPVAVGLAWAWLTLVYAPATQGVTVRQLHYNDVGLTLLITGCIALGWSLPRAALAIIVLRRRTGTLAHAFDGATTPNQADRPQTSQRTVKVSEHR